MNRSDTKKAIAELVFWFSSLTIIRLILLIIDILNARLSPVSSHIIFIVATIVAGNVVSALGLTLLNRLLQNILKRME